MTDPKSIFDTFTDSIQSSSNKHFRLSHPSPISPRRLWWNNDCQAAVSSAKKAGKEWREKGHSYSSPQTWKTD
jgi:hypothetical protein